MKQNILLLVILISFVSLLADGVLPNGSGTETDPYQVSTLDNLLWVSTHGSLAWDKYFIQTADIDANDTQNWNNGLGFSAIGNYYTNFTGSYDGQGYTINGLYINNPSITYHGLFGYTNGATLSNLGLTNVDINGQDYVGSLVGRYTQSSIITNCYSSGSVCGRNFVGGLMGRGANSSITYSYSNSNVDGEDYIGGLVGHFSNSIISNTYSTGSVNGNCYIAGLVGKINYSSSIIESYSTGGVVSSYSGASGGLISDGSSDSIIMNSFWDIESSGQDYSDGGTGKTTTEMQTQSTFTNAGWDFSSDWVLDGVNNFYYPYFSWQNYDSDTPAIANHPNIIDNSFNQSITGIISWCMTGNATDEYDLWFGEADNMIEVVTAATAEEIGSYSYTVNLSTQYEWKVITRNTSVTPNIETEGNTWSFTTADFYGSGTNSNPFQITNLNDLETLSINNTYWASYFIQINDIDASSTISWNNGEGFSPIGVDFNDDYFSGYYNGQNHTIDGLYIHNPTNVYQGFFGITRESTIENLGITNVDVYGSGNYIGGLVGYNRVNSSITNCFSSGIIDGVQHVGGLVGGNSSSLIAGSHSSCIVTGIRSTGGLVGYNYYSDIVNSFSSGSVSATTNNDYISIHTGGLVGNNSHSSISNCYSISDVSGTYTNDNYSYTGGLAGINWNDANITNSYSTGIVNSTGNTGGNDYKGGLIGEDNQGSVANNCFWDIQTSGLSYSAGGTGKTTTEMQTQSTFTNAGWDFISNWVIDGINNDAYPYFYWQNFGPDMLETPQNVEIITTETSVTITWDIVEGATSYQVFNCDTLDGTFEQDTTGEFNDTSWTAPLDGTKELYFVKACN